MTILILPRNLILSPWNTDNFVSLHNNNEHCVMPWWDENRRTLQTTTNWVLKRKHWVLSFEKQAFFIFITWTDFETRFISQEKGNQPFTKTTNGTAKSTHIYKCICKVHKMGPPKVFYLKVWKIDSVFLYEVYLLNNQNCFYTNLSCQGMYLHALH